MAIYEDTIVSGAPGASGHWDSAGASYVFKRDSNGLWSQQSKLIAHDGETGDKFGSSVGIYYSHIIVGADGEAGKGIQVDGSTTISGPGQGGQHKDGDNCGPHSSPDCIPHEGSYISRGIEAGSVYVYGGQSNNWEQEYKLVATDASEYSAFGKSVAIRDDIIFVGSDLGDGLVQDSGSVYLYLPDTMDLLTPTPTLHPTVHPTVPHPTMGPTLKEHSSFKDTFANYQFDGLVFVTVLLPVFILFCFCCRYLSRSK